MLRLSTSRSAPQSSKIIEAGDIGGVCTSRPLRAVRIPVISRDTFRQNHEVIEAPIVSRHHPILKLLRKLSSGESEQALSGDNT